MALVLKGGLGWSREQAVSIGGGVLATGISASREAVAKGGHCWEVLRGEVSEAEERELVDDLDPREGLVTRVCVSERRWIGFSDVL